MRRPPGDWAAAALLLAGCVPAIPPAPPLAGVAPRAGWLERAAAPDTIAPDWWRAFGDATLDALEARALANNTDLLAAAARVDEARGNLRVARAALLPAIDASVQATRTRQPGSLGTPSVSTSIQPEAVLDWQIDLFGRLRATRRAAQAQLAASEADRAGTALSVAAAVAQGYFALVALDAQLFVTRETVTSRREALRLAEDRARTGYSSQFELTQAQSEYQSVLGQVPELQRGIRNAENALWLLTGDAPRGDFARARLIDIGIPAVPSALPSMLLRRRPDLAAAEAQLAAADAGLAAARAAFLPTVAISASVGQLFVNGLDYDPVTIWTLGGSILAPLFAGGQLRGNFEVARAQRDQAAYAYRGAVLSAFGDVENALTDVRRYAEQIAIVRQRRETLIRSLDLARDRFQGGYASYLDQLDAQRNLYSTELEAITIRQSQLQAIVSLAQAFGGGYAQPAADPTARR